MLSVTAPALAWIRFAGCPLGRSNCRATKRIFLQALHDAACDRQTARLKVPVRHLPGVRRRPLPDGVVSCFRACPAASHWVTRRHRHPTLAAGLPILPVAGADMNPGRHFRPAPSTGLVSGLPLPCDHAWIQGTCLLPTLRRSRVVHRSAQTDRQKASGVELFASWLALLSWPTTRNRSATVADDPPDRTTTRGFIMPGETMAPTTAPRFLSCTVT
jgi:hypothetical protein